MSSPTKAIVHHNSRHADCTISENQDGLKPYEVRVYIGERGANALYIDKNARELVAHKDNVDINDSEEKEVKNGNV